MRQSLYPPRLVWEALDAGESINYSPYQIVFLKEIVDSMWSNRGSI